MSDSLKNIPKSTRIGGKGTIRRKGKATKNAPVDLNAALAPLKKNIASATVNNLLIEYEDKSELYANPDMKILMNNKKQGIAYIISGRRKTVDVKPDEKPEEIERYEDNPVKAMSDRIELDTAEDVD